jgi:hypothetical protein
MQFEADKVDKDAKRRNLSVVDTWNVCYMCSFSERVNGNVSIENSMKEHCMDCPNWELRDALYEREAEALNS